MDDKEFARVSEAMGGLVGQTETQVMALLVSTWAALEKERAFDAATIRDILDQADAQIGADAPRGMIDLLRRRLFPPH